MSRFSRPQPNYNPQDEAQFRAAVEAALQKMFERGQSIEMWPGTFVYLRSDDGNRWKLSVSNAGAVTADAA